ncbi:MAG TPA: sugar phosphate isomerase/epimerase family protein, partial [Planctomycetota bacterium]|nr:sugar phosphate isomerase/epimerase family protein [Planctomycetota bacterium]
KIGMNMLLWTTHVTEADAPHLERIRAAGFDGVEIPIFEGNAEHYKKLRAVLDAQGLGCTTVTVSTEDANPISADASVRQKAVDDLKLKIELTAILGGEVLCGPYHQPLGVFSGDGPTEDEKKRAADVHRQAAEFAESAGVKLGIEYLNRFECYFLNTAHDAAQHVARVGHPAFRMMYDTFHANIEEKDPIGAFRDNAASIVHFHVSENDRGTPGTGHVPWLETFRAVRQSGYDGWMTIEAFGRALPDLAAATRVWRDFFARREDVYEQGIRFIREMWDKAARA